MRNAFTAVSPAERNGMPRKRKAGKAHSGANGRKVTPPAYSAQGMCTNSRNGENSLGTGASGHEERERFFAERGNSAEGWDTSCGWRTLARPAAFSPNQAVRKKVELRSVWDVRRGKHLPGGR